MLNAKQNHEISLIAVTDRSNSRIVNIQVWTCPISGGLSFRFPLSPPSSSSPEKGQFIFLSLSFVCLLVSASPFYLIQLLNMVSSFSVCVPTHRIVDQRWNFCFLWFLKFCENICLTLAPLDKTVMSCSEKKEREIRTEKQTDRQKNKYTESRHKRF